MTSIMNIEIIYINFPPSECLWIDSIIVNENVIIVGQSYNKYKLMNKPSEKLVLFTFQSVAQHKHTLF